jgi:hypothetical protein
MEGVVPILIWELSPKIMKKRNDTLKGQEIDERHYYHGKGH